MHGSIFKCGATIFIKENNLLIQIKFFLKNATVFHSTHPLGGYADTWMECQNFHHDKRGQVSYTVAQDFDFKNDKT